MMRRFQFTVTIDDPFDTDKSYDDMADAHASDIEGVLADEITTGVSVTVTRQDVPSDLDPKLSREYPV